MAIIGGLRDALPAGTGRRHVQFLGATMLYESGQLQRCLSALDFVDAEPGEVSSDEQRSTQLMRAVALLKLGRLDEAEQVLSGIDPDRGDEDSRAQVIFLKGWIDLSQSRPAEGLVHFRQLMADYPGSSYAKKTQPLIDRLEASVEGRR